MHFEELNGAYTAGEIDCILSESFVAKGFLSMDSEV